jgi:alpha-galactosidase
MGWNSWDAFGFTINEADFRANVTVLAGLRRYGWKYAVIDEGWYMENPFGTDLDTRKYRVDGHGLLQPVVSRFPSAAAGAGFKPLADWVHSQGLEFGIHIVRGIPKQAVRDNLSIADSPFHAADVADPADVCPWDDGDYGVRDTAAGQAYYDSMLKLYAGWGVDFLKVDCIADHPYKGAEIRQIAAAIKKTGRPIVLSLSPGPANLAHAAELAQYAQMWRISNDVWDGWAFTHERAADDFPNGVASAFDNLAKWYGHAKPGNWPDADMLPFGSLRPHPGWGEPRLSRLSREEERTQLTLWAIGRSPLILGGNLTQLDDFTRSLLTNRTVLEVNQQATVSHPVTDLPGGFEQVRVWAASTREHGRSRSFLAFFNLDDKPVTVHPAWTQLGLGQGEHSAVSLWDSREISRAAGIEVVLPAHGAAIYRVK